MLRVRPIYRLVLWGMAHSWRHAHPPNECRITQLAFKETLQTLLVRHPPAVSFDVAIRSITVICCGVSDGTQLVTISRWAVTKMGVASNATPIRCFPTQIAFCLDGWFSNVVDQVHAKPFAILVSIKQKCIYVVHRLGILGQKLGVFLGTIPLRYYPAIQHQYWSSGKWWSVG